MSSASPTRSPIGMRGLSEACASWKMICSLRRIAAGSRLLDGQGDPAPLEQHAAAARPHELQDAHSRSSTCRSPIRRPGPAYSPRSTVKLDAVDRLHRARRAGRPKWTSRSSTSSRLSVAHGARSAGSTAQCPAAELARARAACSGRPGPATRQRGRNGQSGIGLDRGWAACPRSASAGRTAAVDARRRAHEPSV